MIPVPEKIIRKWKEFIDEFDDFLWSQDENFIKKMRKARKEHLIGTLTDLDV